MEATSAADRITLIASGQVQGVGYRAFARRHAVDLGLSGYAENLADGRVEVVAEGWRPDLELLIVRLRIGPSHAEVKDLQIVWGKPGGLSGFFVY